MGVNRSNFLNNNVLKKMNMDMWRGTGVDILRPI
jgi:hypothetical protein